MQACVNAKTETFKAVTSVETSIKTEGLDRKGKKIY